MPTDEPIAGKSGLVNIAWRTFFDSIRSSFAIISNRMQTIGAGGKIRIVSAGAQVAFASGSGGPQNLAPQPFEGVPKDGGKVTVICGEHALTFIDSDTDGGCLLGANEQITENQTMNLVYIESRRRYFRI